MLQEYTDDHDYQKQACIAMETFEINSKLHHSHYSSDQCQNTSLLGMQIIRKKYNPIITCQAQTMNPAECWSPMFSCCPCEHSINVHLDYQQCMA